MKLKRLNKWMALLTNVGVLIGIALLVYDLNQNADLMRAEMHAMRALASPGVARILSQTCGASPRSPACRCRTKTAAGR